MEFLAIFREVPDPRVERTRVHPLINILTLALLSVICVGDGWEDLEEFGQVKEEWLATFLDLSNGVPRADTFRRVISALEPGAFNACFMAWAEALCEGTAGKVSSAGWQNSAAFIGWCNGQESTALS